MKRFDCLFLAAAIFAGGGVFACGGGDDGDDAPDAAEGAVDAMGDDSPDAMDDTTDVDGEPGGEEPPFAERSACDMLPVTIRPAGGPGACAKVIEGDCNVGNDEFLGCDFLSEDLINFEWDPGVFYNVKSFGWTPVSSSHGEVTTMTNATGGILGIPTSTEVTAVFTYESDGSTWEIVFRMEDDYVVFLSFTEQ